MTKPSERAREKAKRMVNYWLEGGADEEPDIAAALDEFAAEAVRKEREAIADFARVMIQRAESFSRGGQHVGTSPSPAVVQFARDIVHLIEARGMEEKK